MPLRVTKGISVPLKISLRQGQAIIIVIVIILYVSWLSPNNQALIVAGCAFCENLTKFSCKIAF